ncbi:MAG: RagB/SusD family nutrient uptake outer membrane protein, partial [Draconibacterium sp.]
MKIISSIFIVIVLVAYLTSCEDMMGDFLEKAPGVDVTEDTIFSSQVQVETFIAGTYLQGLHSILPLIDDNDMSGNQHFAMTECSSDEGEPESDWYPQTMWQTGSVEAVNIDYAEDAKWSARWQAIRRCNILIERIEAVPGINQDYISQVKGEALFIRSLTYFEMLKRYGGIPIVDMRLDVNADLLLPRNTIKEVVDYIVKGCTEAAGYLPDTYSSGYRGRATKGAALILKSKTLLYAASPLFNTNNPYIDLGTNNNLICYTNYDNNRWQLAVDAAKAVINWAPIGGIALVTDQGVDKNYKYVWEVNDNQEIILANKQAGYVNLWSFPWNTLIPKTFGWSWDGMSAPLNFQKLYEKKDGTPQTWEGGNDLNLKYLEMDPRFAQTFAYNGAYWSDNFPYVAIYQGGAHSGSCKGGVHIHKRVPDALGYGRPQVPNNILFRLAEAYLNYAEALNEVQGPVPEAYEAVNIIRSRSGMPDLPTGLSKEDFRKHVHNERAVELS